MIRTNVGMFVGAQKRQEEEEKEE